MLWQLWFDGFSKFQAEKCYTKGVNGKYLKRSSLLYLPAKLWWFVQNQMFFQICASFMCHPYIFECTHFPIEVWYDWLETVASCAICVAVVVFSPSRGNSCILYPTFSCWLEFHSFLEANALIQPGAICALKQVFIGTFLDGWIGNCVSQQLMLVQFPSHVHWPGRSTQLGSGW